MIIIVQMYPDQFIFNCAWTVLNLPSPSLMVKVYLLSCMLHKPPLQFWKMCNNNETVCFLCRFTLLSSRHSLENVNIRLSTSFMSTENLWRSIVLQSHQRASSWSTLTNLESLSDQGIGAFIRIHYINCSTTGSST